MAEENTAKRINRKRLAKVIDYTKTFQSEHGKRVLYDLLEAHGLMSTNFHENANVMAAREGERSVVLRILQILKTDQQKMAKLIEDAHEHIQKDNRII